MKINMFTQILLASLLPVILIFVIVIATMQNIIMQNNVDNAEKSVEQTIANLSDNLNWRFDHLENMLKNTSIAMGSLEPNSPDTKEQLEKQLFSLADSIKYTYCTWYAFEPEVFGEEKHYTKNYLRRNGILEVFIDPEDEFLDDPEITDWYHIPLNSGKAETILWDLYSYGDEDDDLYTFSLTFPIYHDNKVIGCVGADMRFDEMFNIEIMDYDTENYTMLISETGVILFSSDGKYIGESIFNFSSLNTAFNQTISEKGLVTIDAESPLTKTKSLAAISHLKIPNSNQPAYLYQETSLETVQEEFEPSFQLIIITSVLGLLLLTYSVFLINRRTASNITNLTESFKRIADSDDLDILKDQEEPSPTTIVELNSLNESKIRMVEKLQKVRELEIQKGMIEVEREKLVATAHAKNNFFASISHEIRTPMNSILGISEIMLHDKNITAEQKEHIKDINVSADALLVIINDILDMSKLETDKMKLHFEPFDFTAFISNINSLGTHLAESANLNFDMTVDENISQCFIGDEIRLRQILLNLIGNATKFTEIGSVEVNVYLENDERLRFDVIDTGIGMEQEALTNIFEPFTRSATKKVKYIEGSGLGLPISKNLVALMDGDISVISEVGNGSTFSVTIPYTPGKEESLPKVKDTKNIELSSQIKVLVVDDNVINLRVSSGLLKASCGVNCDTAISGYEAIEMLKQDDYDIVFMDHMMPELDGVETTKLIREMGGKYETLPIIALTANAVIGVRAELLDAGMNDYLTKPININLLKDILCIWAPEDKKMKSIEKVLLDDEPDIDVSSIDVKKTLEKFDTVSDLVAYEGLKNIGGEESLYIESLDLSRRAFTSTADLLDKLLDSGDLKNFQIHVHGLKSSFANIGAASLSTMAKDLETASADMDFDYCNKHFPDLYIRIKVMCNELDKVFETESKAEKKAIVTDYVEFESRMQNLTEAMQDHDFETITEYIESLSETDFGNEKNDFISKIKLLVDSFNYSEAIKEIEQKLKAI